jgi:pimeloyl-ACP methyl ester carboxylesterase
MTTFVLVHGGWLGGWCWSRVSKLLSAKQHTVIAPTLTGLGERSHLLNSEIDLDTHVLDVVNTMKWQELRDVVLVGHSYGGMVTAGVAEMMEKSIATFVLLDSFLPASGQSVVDVIPVPQFRDPILKAASDGATTLPPPSAASFNVNEDDRAWVDAQCTPLPIKCFLQKIVLTGARDRIAQKAFIRATNFYSPPSDDALLEARNKGWKTFEIGAGHEVMIDAPAQLADVLEGLA